MLHIATYLLPRLALLMLNFFICHVSWLANEWVRQLKHLQQSVKKYRVRKGGRRKSCKKRWLRRERERRKGSRKGRRKRRWKSCRIKRRRKRREKRRRWKGSRRKRKGGRVGGKEEVEEKEEQELEEEEEELSTYILWSMCVGGKNLIYCMFCVKNNISFQS